MDESREFIRTTTSLALAVCAALGATPGQAQQDVLEEIVVFGRNTELLGAAEAATEGSVSGADLLVRPMLRVAELLEAVPGMVAVQHSGSGKANQYFLRGFNLDHGTDFTTYVDGVPWNLRSHGHGQGYLDVNGLLPEIVERIDYRKGPYRAVQKYIHKVHTYFS
jgi:outer membrane cobalamin receptor